MQHESTLQTELLHAEKLAGIGSFAAGIAHDMNNPLQLILGLAENLVDEGDLECRACSSTGHHRCRQTYDRHLSRSYLLLAPHLLTARLLVGITGKLDEALKIARYAVALQDIDIRKLYQPDVVVKGNPDELLHVFVNLITNAVQAMEHHGTLTLAASADGRHDTGSCV